MMGFSRLRSGTTSTAANCDSMINVYLGLMFAMLMINLPVSSANPIASSRNVYAARNIRHLPCIVRKSGLSGVCMFAINCIKRNGTHLGTCIDRFYFGSCCQLKDEPLQEILDNSIDQNTISHFSLESTSKQPTSVLYKLTSEPNLIKNISRNDLPIEHKEDAMELTTFKSTTIAKITSTTSSTTKRESLTRPFSSSSVVPQKFSTFQTVDTTTPYERPRPISLTTTIKPLVNRHTTSSSTSITENASTSTSTQRPKITRKPESSTSSSSIKTTVKPRPQITKRPVTTRKPISQSTKRPPSVINFNNATALTSRPKPTRRPIIATTTETHLTTYNSTTLSESTTTKSSLTSQVPRPKPKPTAEIIKSPPHSTTEKAVLTTKLTTLMIKTTSKPTTTRTTILTTTSTAEPTSTTTTLATTTSTLAPVLFTTHKPVFVTWTEISDDKVNKTEITNNDTTPPSADWVPVLTIRPENDANKTIVSSVPSSTTEKTADNLTTQSTPHSENHKMNVTEIEDSLVTTTSSEATITTESSVPIKNNTTYFPLTPSESIESFESEEQITENYTNDSILEVSSTTISSMEDIDYRKVCGRRMYPQPRVVGGSNAAFGRWPWQISLRQWRTSTYLHKCGAALLNQNWAITAAHCVDNVPPSDLLLRLGEYDLAEEEEPYGYQERKVQIVASHPQFDQRTFEYDLALLRFYEPVVFQPNIIPVCVPDSNKNYIGQTAYVTGWGRLYEDGPLPSVLQEVAVPIINNTICEAMYYEAGYKESIPHIFICAGWRKGGYDSCEGDSGGPMVIQREEDKRFILGGVISWGIGCAEPNQPGVYTRISEFRDWINQILQF